MSESITIVGDDEVQNLLKNLPSFYARETKMLLGKAVLKTQSDILDNFSHGSSGLSSNKLNSRTGNLARSIKTSVKGVELNELSANVYTDSIYAPLQEKGGDVKAKNKYARVPGGPYLNIPTNFNKTAAGVMRLSSREVFGMGGYIAKSKTGNWFVFALDGKPMFILKRSVTVPARLGMIDAGIESAKTLLDDLNKLNLGDI
jgi:hypothetical protein